MIILANKGVRKALLAISAVCIFIMIILVILDYTEPTYKEFGLENFYTGYVGDEGDPKAAYDEVSASSILGNASCDTVMKLPSSYDRSLDNRYLGGHLWIAATSSDSDVPSDTSSLDTQTISPYSEGDYIVAPEKVYFRNSNVDQSLVSYGDGVCMEVLTASGYVIRWNDMYCWYCHINKENVIIMELEKNP